MASVGVTVPEKMHIFFDYSRKIGQNQKSAIVAARTFQKYGLWRSSICELANNNIGGLSGIYQSLPNLPGSPSRFFGEHPLLSNWFWGGSLILKL
jgi:hypothetical protein